MRRTAIVTLFAASALVLSGCVTVVAPDRGRDDDRPIADELDNRSDVRCVPGEELLLNDPSTLYTVIGPCEDLTVEGTDLVIRVEEVENLVIRGDRNLVEGREIESVEISGQDNTVKAEVIDDVEIAGDRNAVESDEPIDDADVSGNDNDVD